MIFRKSALTRLGNPVDTDSDAVVAEVTSLRRVVQVESEGSASSGDLRALLNRRKGSSTSKRSEGSDTRRKVELLHEEDATRRLKQPQAASKKRKTVK